MTDAERLTLGFVPSIRESPFRIAPERVQALMAKMGGSAWPLDIVEGPVNFKALPQTQEIKGTYAALLSLWAVAASARIMLVITQTASDLNLEQVVIKPGDPGFIAIELKNAALALIRDHASLWTIGELEPDPAADPFSEDGLTNNLFLAAASFVILHECGHLVQDHLEYTALLHQQEREADSWAVSWILDQAPDEMHRQFRTLAICIAFIWIGLIDEVRRAESTHPSAVQRFGDAFKQFGDVPEDSLALEISSYLMKAFFDPTSAIQRPEHALDAFVEQLIDYPRRR
jgi:hypothetical protein